MLIFIESSDHFVVIFINRTTHTFFDNYENFVVGRKPYRYAFKVCKMYKELVERLWNWSAQKFPPKKAYYSALLSLFYLDLYLRSSLTLTL